MLIVKLGAEQGAEAKFSIAYDTNVSLLKSITNSVLCFIPKKYKSQNKVLAVTVSLLHH